MSTKEQPGPFDGLERAAPDEPVFTLRAHDVLAAPLVREWVDRRRKAILHGNLPADKERVELIQAREAEEIAEAMEEWRSGRPAEEETHAPTPQVSYNGNETDADELAAKRQFDTIKAAARKLDNSVAEITEAAEMLREYGFDHEVEALLQYAELVKEIAAGVTPKRASYAHRATSEEAPITGALKMHPDLVDGERN